MIPSRSGLGVRPARYLRNKIHRETWSQNAGFSFRSEPWAPAFRRMFERGFLCQLAFSTADWAPFRLQIGRSGFGGWLWRVAGRTHGGRGGVVGARGRVVGCAGAAGVLIAVLLYSKFRSRVAHMQPTGHSCPARTFHGTAACAWAELARFGPQTQQTRAHFGTSCPISARPGFGQTLPELTIFGWTWGPKLVTHTSKSGPVSAKVWRDRPQHAPFRQRMHGSRLEHASTPCVRRVSGTGAAQERNVEKGGTMRKRDLCGSALGPGPRQGWPHSALRRGGVGRVRRGVCSGADHEAAHGSPRSGAGASDVGRAWPPKPPRPSEFLEDSSGTQAPSLAELRADTAAELGQTPCSPSPNADREATLLKLQDPSRVLESCTGGGGGGGSGGLYGRSPPVEWGSMAGVGLTYLGFGRPRSGAMALARETTLRLPPAQGPLDFFLLPPAAVDIRADCARAVCSCVGAQ